MHRTFKASFFCKEDGASGVRFCSVEFVVFFTDCKEKEVRDFIERFRDSLLKHQDKEWKELQVAVGYEAAGEGEDAINDLINRADLKMYENKRKQREI